MEWWEQSLTTAEKKGEESEATGIDNSSREFAIKDAEKWNRAERDVWSKEFLFFKVRRYYDMCRGNDEL